MIEETTQKEDSSIGKLLSVEERAACEILAAEDSLRGRRAQALLALDEGTTQREAGEVSGLTLGQVKYLLKRFRSDGMSIFPNAEPTQPQADDEALPVDDPPPSMEIETAVVPATAVEADQPADQPDQTAEQPDQNTEQVQIAEPSSKPKKGKKTKKSKKKKRVKKTKKAKKKGKNKKSDKKTKKAKQTKKKKGAKRSKKKDGGKKSKKAKQLKKKKDAKKSKKKK